jgi:hypothetical protein
MHVVRKAKLTDGSEGRLFLDINMPNQREDIDGDALASCLVNFDRSFKPPQLDPCDYLAAKQSQNILKLALTPFILQLESLVLKSCYRTTKEIRDYTTSENLNLRMVSNNLMCLQWQREIHEGALCYSTPCSLGYTGHFIYVPSWAESQESPTFKLNLREFKLT